MSKDLDKKENMISILKELSDINKMEEDVK
jgi:hypothetical protein